MRTAVFIVRTAFFASGAMVLLATLSAAGWYEVPLPFGLSASQWRLPALGFCVITAPILLTYAFPMPDEGKTGREDGEP